jgi:hypothetical protein
MFAMGWSSVALPSSDPVMASYNPAQLGVQSFNNNLSASFVSTDWLPSYDRIEMSSTSINGGINLGKYLGNVPPISLGFGYSRLKVTYPEYWNSTPPGNKYDKADNFTLSAAVDYYVKASVGFTYKHVDSNPFGSVTLGDQLMHPSATANLFDWGIFLQVPVFPIMEKSMARPLRVYDNFSPVLDLSFGFSNSNLGQNSISYISNAFADALPRLARTGIGLTAGIQYEKNGVSIMPLSGRWTVEATDLLVKEDASTGYKWVYQSGFGDIKFFKDVIGGKSNGLTEKQKGWELNLLETVSLYWGRFEEAYDMRSRYFKTSGWGLRSAGLFKVLQILTPELLGHNVLSYAFSHLDFRYTIGKVKTDIPSLALDNQKFSSFSVIFYGL